MATGAAAAALLAAERFTGTALARSRRKIAYGAAVALDDLNVDPRLGRAIANACTQIVPVSELKWSALRPAPDRFAFEKADAIARFAIDNGLEMRGHTLVWYAEMPDWTNEIDSEFAAEHALREHIERVVSRYRGLIKSWDVVNEVIPDLVSEVTDRRPSLWSRHLGNRYIPLAFRIAAEVDPDAQLVLNEYDIEFATPTSRKKRAAFRHLVLELKDAGVPISAVGLQCHLRGELPIDIDGVAAFVAEMRASGIACLVTELDVMDQEMPAPEPQRDALIASKVSDVLSAVTAAGPIDAVLTWGISDRYSWIPYAAPRRDHRPNRPLPLDRDFQRKPFMDVIDQFTGKDA
jgi:endo-1,4-beta-xylanase